MIKAYKTAVSEDRLLCIDFTSLSEYLWLLRAICQQLSDHGALALLYLAAAVSDFYIPADKMVSLTFPLFVGHTKNFKKHGISCFKYCTNEIPFIFVIYVVP